MQRKAHIDRVRMRTNTNTTCIELTMPIAVFGRDLFGLAPPPPTKWLGAALDGRRARLPMALAGLPRAILVLLEAVPGLGLPRGIALPGRRAVAT